MSTQLASFLFFGSTLILVYLFYKKHDRNNVLIILAGLFILPFSFKKILIETDYGFFSFFLAILLFAAARFIKSHHRYFCLYLGVYLFSMIFTIGHIEILYGMKKPIKYITLASEIEYKFKNNQVLNIPIKGKNLMINNTDQILYVESVEYGEDFMSESSTTNQTVQEIQPFSLVKLKNEVGYYFEEPPVIVTTYYEQGEERPEKTTYYWLHN
jgi:hypothetical protein